MDNHLDFSQYELFFQAFKLAPIGMALVSPEGQWLQVNSSLCHILGYSESELLDLTFQDVTHPEDLNRALDVRSQFLEDQIDSYQMEKRYIQKNGFTIWVLVSISIVRDEHRHPLFFISQIKDITQRKIAEEELRRSNESLAIAQRIAQLGNWEADLKTGEIHWSEEYYRIFGLNPNENITSHETFLSLVHPDDRDRLITTGKEALEGKLYDIEYRIIRPNGEERNIHSRGTVIFDEAGKPLKMNGIAQDITDRTQQQRKLRESEELLKLIFENAQDIITISSPEGRVQHISPYVKKLLGYDPEEVLGTLSHESFHPEDWVTLANSNLLQGSDEDTFACRVKHKDGHYIWCETRVKLIRDENGNVIKIIGVGRDISERKQAEEEIKRTKERFESVIRHNADAIWMVDLQDTFLEVNASFETMFGWSPEDIEGKKLTIIPDFLKESMEKNHECVKSGKAVVSLETIRQRKDGSLLDVEATLSPVRDHNGHIIGITGICRDITRRKRTEEELQSKTEQLESFIENNADAFLIFNHNGMVQRVNKTFEKMFGWSREDIIGMQLNRLPFIPDECSDELRYLQGELDKGRSVTDIETIRKNKNGEILNVLLSTSPIPGLNGNLQGWSVTLRDITEWKKAQEHLQNSEKLSVVSQLAAGVAHEIRNPLTAIKGFIRLLNDKIPDEAYYFGIVLSEIGRVELILNELVVLAKPKGAAWEKKKIGLIISQVADFLRTQAILHNIEIVELCYESELEVWADENGLKQVLINLIKNAIESMPNGGQIHILLNRINDEIDIRIIDQGCGIPPDKLEKIGTPFFTTKENGTGLGMMISYNIIENHNGKMSIKSEVNKGTTFIIRLPIFNKEIR